VLDGAEPVSCPSGDDAFQLAVQCGQMGGFDANVTFVIALGGE